MNLPQLVLAGTFGYHLVWVNSSIVEHHVGMQLVQKLRQSCAHNCSGRQHDVNMELWSDVQGLSVPII